MANFEESSRGWGDELDQLDAQLTDITLGPYVLRLVDADVWQLCEAYDSHMEAFDEDILLDETEELITLQAVSDLLEVDFERSAGIVKGDLLCVTGEAVTLSVDPEDASLSVCPITRGGRVVGRIIGVSICESPLEEDLVLINAEEDSGEDRYEDVEHALTPRAVLLLEDARYEDADDDRGSNAYRDESFPEGHIVAVPIGYSGLVVAKVLDEIVIRT